MKIQESAENYLETILVLKERKGLVRSIDIANELEFSKPSVSIAMRNLRENGYVSMDAGGFITLLPAGQEIAERIYERHRLLTKWLTGLGVDPAIASEDACRIEHDISEETFEKPPSRRMSRNTTQNNSEIPKTGIGGFLRSLFLQNALPARPAGGISKSPAEFAARRRRKKWDLLKPGRLVKQELTPSAGGGGRG